MSMTKASKKMSEDLAWASALVGQVLGINPNSLHLLIPSAHSRQMFVDLPQEFVLAPVHLLRLIELGVLLGVEAYDDADVPGDQHPQLRLSLQRIPAKEAK